MYCASGSWFSPCAAGSNSDDDSAAATATLVAKTLDTLVGDDKISWSGFDDAVARSSGDGDDALPPRAMLFRQLLVRSQEQAKLEGTCCALLADALQRGDFDRASLVLHAAQAVAAEPAVLTALAETTRVAVRSVRAKLEVTTIADRQWASLVAIMDFALLALHHTTVQDAAQSDIDAVAFEPENAEPQRQALCDALLQHATAAASSSGDAGEENVEQRALTLLRQMFVARSLEPMRDAAVAALVKALQSEEPSDSARELQQATASIVGASTACGIASPAALNRQKSAWMSTINALPEAASGTLNELLVNPLPDADGPASVIVTAAFTLTPHVALLKTFHGLHEAFVESTAQMPALATAFANISDEALSPTRSLPALGSDWQLLSNAVQAVLESCPSITSSFDASASDFLRSTVDPATVLGVFVGERPAGGPSPQLEAWRSRTAFVALLCQYMLSPVPSVVANRDQWVATTFAGAAFQGAAKHIDELALQLVVDHRADVAHAPFLVLASVFAPVFRAFGLDERIVDTSRRAASLSIGREHGAPILVAASSFPMQPFYATESNFRKLKPEVVLENLTNGAASSIGRALRLSADAGSATTPVRAVVIVAEFVSEFMKASSDAALGAGRTQFDAARGWLFALLELMPTLHQLALRQGGGDLGFQAADVVRFVEGIYTRFSTKAPGKVASPVLLALARCLVSVTHLTPQALTDALDADNSAGPAQKRAAEEAAATDKPEDTKDIATTEEGREAKKVDSAADAPPAEAKTVRELLEVRLRDVTRGIGVGVGPIEADDCVKALWLPCALRDLASSGSLSQQFSGARDAGDVRVRALEAVGIGPSIDVVRERLADADKASELGSGPPTTADVRRATLKYFMAEVYERPTRPTGRSSKPPPLGPTRASRTPILGCQLVAAAMSSPFAAVGVARMAVEVLSNGSKRPVAEVPIDVPQLFKAVMELAPKALEGASARQAQALATFIEAMLDYTRDFVAEVQNSNGRTFKSCTGQADLDLVRLAAKTIDNTARSMCVRLLGGLHSAQLRLGATFAIAELKHAILRATRTHDTLARVGRYAAEKLSATSSKQKSPDDDDESQNRSSKTSFRHDLDHLLWVLEDTEPAARRNAHLGDLWKLTRQALEVARSASMQPLLTGAAFSSLPSAVRGERDRDGGAPTQQSLMAAITGGSSRRRRGGDEQQQGAAQRNGDEPPRESKRERSPPREERDDDRGRRRGGNTDDRGHPDARRHRAEGRREDERVSHDPRAPHDGRPPQGQQGQQGHGNRGNHHDARQADEQQRRRRVEPEPPRDDFRRGGGGGEERKRGRGDDRRAPSPAVAEQRDRHQHQEEERRHGGGGGGGGGWGRKRHGGRRSGR